MPPRKGQQRAARRIKTRVTHLKIDAGKIDLDLSLSSMSIYVYLSMSISLSHLCLSITDDRIDT